MAHYSVVTFGDMGLIFGSLLYYASISCSLSGLTYSFFLPFYLYNTLGMTETTLYGTLLYFMVMMLFICGKRFRSALKGRLDIHKNVRVSCAGKWDMKRIFIVPKVIAYYITCSLTPPWRMKGGFFPDAPVHIHKYDRDGIFYASIVLIILFYGWAWMIDPFMAVWHLVFVALYCQFKVYGMIVADRYQSVFTIALCVILSKALSYEHMLILASLWFYRSYIYIKIFKNNEVLFRESMIQYPHASENATNLASDFMRHKKHNNAIVPLLVALKLSEPPINPLIYQNLSVCYLRVGQFTKALEYTDLALRRCPLDSIETLKRQRKDIEKEIKKLMFHRKTLKRRGII